METSGHYFNSASQSADESWVATISDSLGLGVIVINKNLTIDFFNKRCLELLDLPHDDTDFPPKVETILAFLAQRGDFGKVSTEVFIQQQMEVVSKATRGEVIKSFRSIIVPPNGRTLKIKRHPSANGSLIVTIEDISAQCRKDKAFKIALELGKAGYWTYNFKSNEFEVHSEYLVSILTPDEMEKVRADNFLSILHKDDVDAAECFWKDTVNDPAPRRTTFRIKTVNYGVLWLRTQSLPQVTETGDLISIICFFEDVTDDLALEDDLRQSKNQAVKTLEAQNSFLARLSHEVRTPMNAVIGITDALIQYTDDPKTKPKLELIQSSADSIMNILEGTLSHTKLDADKLKLDPKLGNPRETVKTICKLWDIQAKKNGTTIRCHIDDKAPDEIEFDRFRYEQCLNNLLSNAVKFTPHGRVDVILTLVGGDTRSPRLVLAVKDTGIGMTPAQQARIFDAFTQADKSISSRFGGTGLGMNITKNIIEMMGGKISVKSVIGEGTVFALALPVTLKENADILTEPSLINQILNTADEEAEDDTPYSKLKILVADDNPTNHMVIESLLETVVGKIYQANNGQEVLDILDVQDIDIVLMDIHMPVMDGIESTLAIRRSDKHWSDILIIAVTADPQYQQLRLCKNIGMDESLAKPVKLSGILEAFDRVLELDRNSAPHKDIYKKTA